MKVILYLAITANGFIAKNNDAVDFVSPSSWASYRDIVLKTGNVVVGRKTFTLMQAAGDLDGLKDVTTIVVGHHAESSTNPPIISFVDSPKSALRRAEELGFEETLIAGGATLNASFLEEKLIDEIYLDIEPIILGTGIPLVKNSEFETKLKLLDTRQIAENEIQLHYRIMK